MIKLTDTLLETLTEKKLCPKGRAYYNRRIDAGEKPSAYLSGRAVKVCKGLMKEDNLYEFIDPLEASNDIKAVQTIIDGKRNIGFIAQRGNDSKDWEQITQMIESNNLKTVLVKGNPFKAYIVYTPESEKDAMELKNIAEKYEGFLSYEATDEDERRIGQLLNYDPKKVEKYIENKRLYGTGYPKEINESMDNDCGCDDDEYDVENEEDTKDFIVFIKEYIQQLSESSISEAEYRGRKVQLGKPMQGDVKKFKVYVKNPKGNVVKVNFGQKGMNITKNNPKRRAAYRARHHCSNPGPRHKANYWSCRKW